MLVRGSKLQITTQPAERTRSGIDSWVCALAETIEDDPTGSKRSSREEVNGAAAW